MATIIVFASSLLIAVLLLALKVIELKYGKKNIFLNLINKLEARAVKTLTWVNFTGLQIIQSLRYIVLVKIKNATKDLFKKVEDRLFQEFKKRQDIVMGRKEILSKGSASFYLKKITETKGVEKGKIEDTLLE